MRTKERDIPYCGVRYKVIKKANPVLNELLYIAYSYRQ